MLGKIPKNRLILYTVLCGLFPILFMLVRLSTLSSEATLVEEKTESVSALSLAYKKRQANNIATVNHYRESDHFYIDKHLETINFLEPEVEALQKIIGHKNFPGDSGVKKRLEFLTGPLNSATFNEGTVQSFPLYQETLESLAHPVEVNVQDIKSLLAMAEGVEIPPFTPLPSRPQLIMLDFKIDRKKHADGNEVFLLNMKLLKREFL